MNSVNIIGRLVKDPEISVSTSGSKETKIARYTLAVDRNQDEADFISCTTFNKTADFVEKYLSKGVKVGVHGRIQTGSYTNKDGAKVYTTTVLVNEHTFCESRQQQAQPQQEEKPVMDRTTEDFMKLAGGIEDELPFK